MPSQYAARDARTGLEVTITGTFPDDPDDRIRIARTSTLFTRLMATILAMEETEPRRTGFRAVETQLEVAEALLRGDLPEVQRLVQETLSQMGLDADELRELEEQLRRQLGGLGLPGDLLDHHPTDDSPDRTV